MLSNQTYVLLIANKTYGFEDFYLGHAFVLSSAHININGVLFGAHGFFQDILLGMASSDTPLELEFPLSLRHLFLIS